MSTSWTSSGCVLRSETFHRSFAIDKFPQILRNYLKTNTFFSDVPQLPILIECTDIGVRFELHVKSILSNCIEVRAVILPENDHPPSLVYIKADRLAVTCVRCCLGFYFNSVLKVNITFQKFPVVVYDMKGFKLAANDDESHSGVQIANLHKLQVRKTGFYFFIYLCHVWRVVGGFPPKQPTNLARGLLRECRV